MAGAHRPTRALDPSSRDFPSTIASFAGEVESDRFVHSRQLAHLRKHEDGVYSGLGCVAFGRSAHLRRRGRKPGISRTNGERRRRLCSSRARAKQESLARSSGETRMKVLVAHNAYQQRGGEDAVVAAETQLVEAHGHAVVRYERQNDELQNRGPLSVISAGLGTVWASKSFREVKALLAREKPDVAHFHNTFPLISPACYYACAEAGVP